MKILGIETSCDETSCAVVKNGAEVLSLSLVSQQDVHSKYGGVIPELGARMHIENISAIYQEALRMASLTITDIDAIAVTQTPGLAPALKAGIAFAKGLSYSSKLPLVGIDHIKAHAYSLFLAQSHKAPTFPIVILTVSGGHTKLIVYKAVNDYKEYGTTIDDAAGEAFDKVARMLTLGYPGGPIIDKISINGDETAIDFPRPMLDSNNFNFSFSGLKTAVLYYLRDKKIAPQLKKTDNPNKEYMRFLTYDIAASFQEAVVDTLVSKTIRLAQKLNIKQIGITGGVSANTRLQEKMVRVAQKNNFDVFFPDLTYCTDNAAMIAGLAYHQLDL